MGRCTASCLKARRAADAIRLRGRVGISDLQSRETELGSKKKVKKEQGAFGSLWGLIKTVVIAVFVALVVRTFLFEPFSIPSASMYPGLLVGDYLFVSKYSYGYSNYSFPTSPDIIKNRVMESPPQRGDVVVFRKPGDESKDFIKRVIGLPGDEIEHKGGRLFINGTRVPRKLVRRNWILIDVARTQDGTPLKRFGRVQTAVIVGDLYDETFTRKDGTKVTHRILVCGSEIRVPFRVMDAEKAGPGALRRYVDQQLSRNPEENPNGGPNFWQACRKARPESYGGKWKVPPGHYFMMGDNRDNSADSRVPVSRDGRDGVGPVPLKNLIGRAEFRFFSSNGAARLWEVWKWPEAIRFNRLFTAIE